MDKELHIIAHLYGEAPPDAPPLRELLQDHAGADEYRALSEARFAVDHRLRTHPDPQLVESVIARAVDRPRPGHVTRWIDRAALRQIVQRRRSLVPVLAVAATIALTVLVRPWTWTSETRVAPTFSEAPAADFAAPESLLRALPPAPALARQASGNLPAWDTGDDVRRLHRRIQALQAAGATEWDEPAIPLEMLPNESLLPGLRQTGGRRGQ